MKQLILYLWTVVLLVGCTDSERTSVLEKTLSENPSLKLVLQRYETDSLKRRAAEYLIENLPYHGGFQAEQMEPYLKMYELFGTGELTIEEVQDSVRKLYGSVSSRQVQGVSDLTLSSEFLIDNIEWAFKVWNEQPWGKNVSFTDFCEYILPYRLADEPLKPWREKVYKAFNPLLDSIRCLPEAADPLFAAGVLIDSLAKKKFNFSSSLGNGPHVGPDLVDWNSGNCREEADRLTYIFRAVGIPCGCDYMPLRGDANVAHFWNFVLDKYGDSYYMYDGRRPEPVRRYWGIKSKVYRQTFSTDRSLVENSGGDAGMIHPDFRYVHFTDVTRLYSGKYARTLYVPVDELSRLPACGVVYLCGASWQEWVPLAATCINDRYLAFDDVEGGVIFTLAIYEQGRLMPVSAPFVLDKESRGIHYFCAGSGIEEIKLLNKYHQFVESFPQRMVNGVFEGSTHPDFRVRDTLAVVTGLPVRLHNVMGVDSKKAYRYVRYYGPENGYCNLSEASFYATPTDSLPLKGHVIGTSNGTHGDGKHDYTNVYDGDPYTSFDYYQPSGGWAGLDLGKPQTIRKIVFTPRNRDNFIRQGDEYELFYDSLGYWISAGRQTAASDSLLYRVPQGALLYLKNHSRGNDERIFEYSDGKQVYW